MKQPTHDSNDSFAHRSKTALKSGSFVFNEHEQSHQSTARLLPLNNKSK